MSKTPLVYDVGMHDGEDSAYYLAKGFNVVGIDADTSRCESCQRRFSQEIESGRMRVLNVGVGAEDGVAKFFLNTREPALSTFADPEPGDEWECRRTPVRRLSSIIREFGEPHFVKIDVEYYDHVVLRDLLANGLIPKSVSVESHLIDVFCLLVSMNYTKFRLVDGATLHQRFGNCAIRTRAGDTIEHTFTNRSSGPFGEDLPDEWIDKNRCIQQLMQHGLGWIDIHAAC